MPLDFSSLEKALASLKKAFVRAQASVGDEELRDACIQRFEYSFELCWKMLKRRIEADIGPSEDIDSYSKKTLFRVGGERGLACDVAAWFRYLEMRNLTAHTYDRENAEEVFSVIGDFIVDADDLLAKLKTAS